MLNGWQIKVVDDVPGCLELIVPANLLNDSPSMVTDVFEGGGGA